MLLERINSVEKFLLNVISQSCGIQLDRLTVENPPRLEFGDLAFPFPFELAKILRRAPRQIAQDIVEKIRGMESIPAGVSRFEAAGAGYVNVFFERLPFLIDLDKWLSTGAPVVPVLTGKIIVEHTNINPNKAAHIGHLRNAALGDTFIRLLRASAHCVEVQNYIDNTGVQVADVVVGFKHLRKLSLEEVKRISDPFDYYCWDLYAEVSAWFAQDESRLNYRRQALAEIEADKEDTARLADYISMRIVRAHLQTMLRIGVRYDVLPRESEILHLKFWERAFQQLRERQAITYIEEGPHRGCWVMRLPSESDVAAEEKIIVRSNGTVTYVGKDIAYQLWKLGLLDRTFHYRPFYQYPDGKTVWVSTVEPASEQEPDFGRGDSVYNVIDVRQSYLQRVVVQGLRGLGFEEQANRSVHFSYEMVALSPACCVEMGIELSEEDRRKPFIEVSGRKGLGVKADDLLNKLEEKLWREVSTRQPDLTPEKRAEIARQIAVGALRYFMLKYARNSVIAFDFNEALSFEGETGPYLQYSVVRANNIFHKLESEDADWRRGQEEMWKGADPLQRLLEDNEIWALAVQTARMEETVLQCLATLEMSHLAKHAFTLAQQFNLFYHKYHILSEQDWLKKSVYLTIADTARRGLLRTLDLLGIEVPARM